MDFERDFELFDGISRASDSSADAYFEMDEDFPDDIRTEDFIVELTSLLVVSERTRQTLDAIGMKNNEFLPVTILNHKGRKEKGPFHILHQVTLQDCIDFEKTVCERNAFDPDLLSSISQFVLDERRIDPEVSLFRPRYFPYAPMFREDLVEKIRSAGLTGIKFTDPSLFKY
ncbi:hypothetical protein A176_002488 [Myxococcus hansupus]|uniref:Immunity MXAN-0049 protein domain-containing protein n=1 Tax=Pseudomyxococcus hansupus TaxID=1297742 RepID=A0A0H4WPZ7_9BACT|nr:DUF1629 domain-containing protein [Myxococcus hansupus]AKQ65576.1 hypothetical protein A176_002488 [Myxococcus hansupus]